MKSKPTWGLYSLVPGPSTQFLTAVEKLCRRPGRKHNLLSTTVDTTIIPEESINVTVQLGVVSLGCEISEFSPEI